MPEVCGPLVNHCCHLALAMWLLR
jgi:hypothetical protein